MQSRTEVEPQMIGAQILGVVGLKAQSEQLVIKTDRGELTLKHEVDCCEAVYLEEFTGTAESLVGAIVTSFTKDTREGEQDRGSHVEMWTFYNLVTSRQDLSLRWYGSSNGYYSIAVHCGWESYLPKLELAFPGTPLAEIRRIGTDGSCWKWDTSERDWSLVMKLTPEGMRDLFSRYSI